MLTLFGIVVGILVVIVITAVTGYFVAQEFAYMAVDRSRLKARAAAGDTSAERALSVTRRTSFMLSGAQLGITVTGLLVGYVAEPLIGSGVGQLLGDVGIPVALGVGIGTVIAIGFSTVVQMVLGELFPKNLAIARPERLARWLARSTTLYLAVFGWLIALFDKSSNLLLRALRIEPVHDVEHSATPRDLERIVAESGATGELPAELSVLLDRVLDFPTRTAEHAMLPRTRVDTVRATAPVGDVIAAMGTGHTRYPVLDGDEVVGVIHLLDLLDWSADATANADATAVDVCRRAVVVPASLPLPQVITEIDSADDQMAVVIDEYGGFAGVVTVEDVAEELVGEIDDEHDREASSVIEHTADGWRVRGDAHLDEVSRAIGHDIPDQDQETLAGLVIAAFQGLPAVGDEITVDLEPDAAFLVLEVPPAPQIMRARVLEIERRVPSTVLLTIEDRPTSTDPTTVADPTRTETHDE